MSSSTKLDCGPIDRTKLMTKAEIAQLAIAINRLGMANNMLAMMPAPKALGNPTRLYEIMDELAEMQNKLDTIMRRELGD